MLCSRPKFGGKQQKTLAFARKCQKSDFNLWSALFVYKAQIFRHYFLSSFSPKGRETGCLRPRLSISSLGLLEKGTQALVYAGC